MLEELRKRIHYCCATLRRSRNKRNVEICWLKSLTGFKLCATTRNNMQQGVQTDATCNIQHCWQLLANNVASICTGLNSTLVIKLFQTINAPLIHQVRVNQHFLCFPFFSRSETRNSYSAEDLIHTFMISSSNTALTSKSLNWQMYPELKIGS